MELKDLQVGQRVRWSFSKCRALSRACTGTILSVDKDWKLPTKFVPGQSIVPPVKVSDESGHLTDGWNCFPNEILEIIPDEQ